jgi:hypothetical protein
MITTKNDKKYICIDCNYITSRRSQYDRHLSTRKHKMVKNDNEKVPKKKFMCECGKTYKYISGLSRHKKICNMNSELSEPNLVPNLESNNLQDLVIKLITENEELKNTLLLQNTELQKTITELIPKIGNNTINNTINNKQNFNIIVFLNEKCKDAISINEFVDKIEVSMKNLLTTKDKGLGEGLSNIIIDNMNKLSLYERPIHCTDKKREVVYIKNDEWEKDNEKEQVNDLIKKVENKQMKNIKQWTDEHPNYMECEKLQEEYINLIRSCTSSIDTCKDKVIKKLCDNVYFTQEETI